MISKCRSTDSKIWFAKKGAPNLGFVRFPKGKLRSAKRGPSQSKTHRLGPKGSAEAVAKNRNGFRDPQKIDTGAKRGDQGDRPLQFWTPGGEFFTARSFQSRKESVSGPRFGHWGPIVAILYPLWGPLGLLGLPFGCFLRLLVHPLGRLWGTMKKQ